ncbi:hypothetical protein BJ508DRAFT_360997 [Ascobolus immersus RN42]|uniref:Uncharacterized protein n=1 Tax=Ascobolus immersus RN42 TaxID=1160509 RepID=A0A3N4I9P6_ASCIM|nr:hypothetical protein BJ508DRAFT_360997 [Ascobolus immersus RN42]
MAANVGAKQFMKKAGKKDPELMVLGGIMVSILGVAGYMMGSKSVTENDTTDVKAVPKSAPWEENATGKGNYKYKYYPEGDTNATPKEAPSALHAVVVPNVTLPKEHHATWNKWGKDV